MCKHEVIGKRRAVSNTKPGEYHDLRSSDKNVYLFIEVVYLTCVKLQIFS